MKKYIDYLVNWIQEEVKKANAEGVVFGLSGGIDSSVVASLVKKAFPNNHLAVIMPCESNSQDKEDGLLVSKELGLNYREIDLTKIWKDFISLIGSKNKLSNANTKSRLRMTIVYNLSQENNYLVLGTSNRDEIHLGYFTKYGDGASDILPIANLSKIEVFELAKNLNINKIIINKPPSAGLIENQTDEEDMGVTYKEVDEYLSNNNGSDHVKDIINTIYNKNKHKSSLVPRAKGIKEYKQI